MHRRTAVHWRPAAGGVVPRTVTCLPRCVCDLVVAGPVCHFLTFITAAYASTNPAPTSHVPYPGSGLAVDVSALSTWSGLSVPAAASCIRATTPAMCGEAIEVPDAHV